MNEPIPPKTVDCKSIYINSLFELANIPELARKASEVLEYAKSFVVLSSVPEVQVEIDKLGVNLYMAVNRELHALEEMRRKPFASLKVLQYEIEPYPKNVLIEYRGLNKWAVTHGGHTMNREGGWEYEPMSSSRDEDYLKRNRFDSAEEAYETYLKTGRRS